MFPYFYYGIFWWKFQGGKKTFPSPLGESGFAYGRSKASPDSEQIERNARECKKRNSVSVEQIQDRVRVRAYVTLIVRSVMVEMSFSFILSCLPQ